MKYDEDVSWDEEIKYFALALQNDSIIKRGNIDDAIEMITKVMSLAKAKNNIINIGSDQNIYSIKSVAKKLAYHLNREVKFENSNKKILFNSPMIRIPYVKFTKRITNFNKETNFNSALIKTINSYI